MIIKKVVKVNYSDWMEVLFIRGATKIIPIMAKVSLTFPMENLSMRGN